MKTKPRFMIGDWVSVRAYVEFNYDHEKRVADKITQLGGPIIGQIVGARRKFMGQYKPGGYDEQSHLAVSGSLWVWLVTEGYLNKPYEVLDEDVELVHTDSVKLPWRKTNVTWTQSEKEDLRKSMKDVPRDSKGRWVK